jgi:CubicO group peptidase (beta-lactamase class C family)
MRRSALLCTTVALLLLSRAPVRAQAQSYAFDVFGDYLESLQVQAGTPGLAAAIVGDSGTLWERAYGRQDLAHAIATRTDTPFHTDGLTQLMTASMVLRCVEEHRLSLDDRVDSFKADSPEPSATIRQLLSHTSISSGNLVFAYRPDRLEPLWMAVRKCTDNSYRETLGGLFHQLVMTDSVPGPDVTRLTPPAEGIPDAADVARYAATLQRLATPYAVDSKGRASVSQYPATTLTPSSGMISTVRDFARFDLALRQGTLLDADTLAAAWRAPAGADGLPLPHGLGWFVQTYNGETVVWQFGLGDDASSSLVMTLPARRLTLILMANSDHLVKPVSLAAGDLTVSPFGKLFLSFFVR